MTRGIPHPENLKPVQTADEAREKGRRGGIASGKARKRRALYREILQDMMAQPIKVPFQDGLLCADELLRRGIAFYTENPGPFIQGVLNALGDIDERRLKEVYLMRTEQI